MIYLYVQHAFLQKIQLTIETISQRSFPRAWDRYIKFYGWRWQNFFFWGGGGRGVNACTCKLSVYCDPCLPSDLWDPLTPKTTSIIESSGRQKWHNINKKINTFGRCESLLQSGYENTKRQDTGWPGRCTRAHTCFQYNGRSVVDYVIVNERLFPSCKTLLILNPNNLSDHAFVTATQQIGTVCPPDTNFKKAKAYKFANIFKWDDGSATFGSHPGRDHDIIASHLLRRPSRQQKREPLV